VCTESYINLTVGLQQKVPHNGCALWFYSGEALWPPSSRELGNKGDKIENEMGGACSTYGRGKVYTGFWWRNLMEKDHFEDPGVGGNIKIDLQEVGWGGGHGLD
jgi:hypothetical protein